jgi:hypothetical protein
MNRDEKRDRFPALPPNIVELESRRAIFPCEPTGGTWISANDFGVCLALINWHRIERQPNSEPLSRGLVVEELAGQSTTQEIATSVEKLPVRKLRPFRLIAIVLAEKRVIEWRWDLRRLAIRDHEWLRQHWFSSGFDEDRAEVERQRVCEHAKHRGPADNLMWLRRLHASHTPKQGPFSICMHRHDAATVSYSEVAVSPRSVVMRYKDGPVCSRRSAITKLCKISRIRATNR